jgi:hypothetical protein
MPNVSIDADRDGDIWITWQSPIGREAVCVPKEAKRELYLWLAHDLADIDEKRDAALDEKRDTEPAPPPPLDDEP